MNMISYLECYNYCDILLWWIRSKLISLTSLYIIWYHVISYHVMNLKNYNKVLQTMYSYSGLFEGEAACNIAWQRKRSITSKLNWLLGIRSCPGEKKTSALVQTKPKCPIFEMYLNASYQSNLFLILISTEI